MERYVIYELQMSEDGTVAHLQPINKETDTDAWAEYYMKLSYAIRSNVFVHTVMLCTATGRLLDSKSYLHQKEEEINETV